MYVTILTISSSDARVHKHEVNKVIYLIKDTLKTDWKHHFKRVQWRKGITLKYMGKLGDTGDFIFPSRLLQKI